jgi:GlpG protein
VVRLSPEIDSQSAKMREMRRATWQSIRGGQIWRLFTPALLHFSLAHLLFNGMALLDFGGQIERNLRSWRFLSLVVVSAVISNVCQALFQSPFFGGLSGIGYALFGFIWMQVTHGRSQRYTLSQLTTYLMMIWFVLCILHDMPLFEPYLDGFIPNTANFAHGGGLLTGIAAAWMFPEIPRS